MKKYILYIGCILLLGSSSCQKEDELTPSGADQDYFLPENSENSQEADLRRDFYEATGVRIIFSNILRIKNEDTIKVDYLYNFAVNYSYKHVSEDYESLEEKQLAVNFLESNILNRIGKIGSPYSIYPLKKLQYTDYYGVVYDVEIINSLKTTAICLGDINALSETEKRAFVNNILSEYIGNKLLSNYREMLDDFFAVSTEKFYEDWSYMYPTFTETDQINGFVDVPDNWDPITRKFDVTTFLKYMLQTSEEDFRATYGSYDKIIQKMEILNTLLKEEFEINIY